MLFKTLAVLLACAAHVEAASKGRTINATVLDSKGNPVKNAVVFIQDAPQGRPREIMHLMAQKDMDFNPGLLVIRVGESVQFPNKDPLHHHIYSFSKTKSFEIPLYKGDSGDPVVFDKPGVVKMGCNIHDWMRGIIFVAPNPYYALTDKNGRARLRAPKGKSHEVFVFHSRLRGKVQKTAKTVALKKGRASAKWAIKLKKARKKKKKKIGYK